MAQTRSNLRFENKSSPQHTGSYMYMEPLKKWAQHGPDSNFTIAISLYFKPSFDEGPIFTTLYWKTAQGLKHIYVVKNTRSEKISCIDFNFQSLFWPLEAIKILFAYFNHLIKAKSSLDFTRRIIQILLVWGRIP